MTVGSNVFKALDEMGIDSSHLYEEEYSLADFENIDAIKSSFPKYGEGLILTNGEDMVNVEGKVRGDHSFVPDDASYFAGVMRLKALKPELPVYELHNHPSVKTQEANGIFFGDGPGDTSPEAEHARKNQRLASSVPSAADIRSWNKWTNLVCQGIYHEDIDEIRIWRNGDVRHRLGAKLALEADSNGALINAYWAPYSENAPNTQYIEPKDWSEDKLQYIVEHYTPQLFAYKG